MNSMLAGGICC